MYEFMCESQNSIAGLSCEGWEKANVGTFAVILHTLSIQRYNTLPKILPIRKCCLWFLLGIILRRVVSSLKFTLVPFVFSIKLLAVQDLLDREALDKVKWGLFSVWAAVPSECTLSLPWFAALQMIWLTTQGTVLRNVSLSVFHLFNVLLLCKCPPSAPHA